jgi:hypothetical protein
MYNNSNKFKNIYNKDQSNNLPTDYLLYVKLQNDIDNGKLSDVDIILQIENLKSKQITLNNYKLQPIYILLTLLQSKINTIITLNQEIKNLSNDKLHADGILITNNIIINNRVSINPLYISYIQKYGFPYNGIFLYELLKTLF